MSINRGVIYGATVFLRRDDEKEFARMNIEKQHDDSF